MFRTAITIFFIMFHTNSFCQWSHFIDFYTPVYTNFYSDFGDIDFTTENNGVYSHDHYQSPSTGTSIHVNSTTNGANSWNFLYSDSGIGNGTYGIYAAREQNTFYHFRNWQGFYRVVETDGYYWHQKAAGQGFSNKGGFYAVDTSHFYCLSSWDKTFLHKYANGVYTKKIDSFPDIQARILFFPDTLVGYIIAASSNNSPNHSILKSTNSGIGWNQILYDSLFNINGMYFTNDSVGYVIGNSGKIVKTSDGGQNWQYLQSATNYNLNSTFFINDSIGYVAGDSGTIIRTKDGGLTWSQQTTFTNKNFRKIFFVNDSIGFAVAENEVYKINMPLSVNKTLESNFCLNIYPNPNSGIFSVETKSKDSQIEIYTVTGKQLHSINKRTYILDVNLHSIFPGMYFVLETKNGKTLNQGKFIIHE